MKNSILILAVMSLFALSFTFPTGVEKVAKADTEKSTITWKGYKVTGSHTGTINLTNGELKFEDDLLVGGGFEIDMSSLACTDLNGEWKQKLEGHLKSGDFFNAEEFPKASFVITKAYPRGTPGDYKVVGNLTIKDVTNEIKFYANVKSDDGQTTATADLEIDRTDYNVKYGSSAFFGSLKDKTIYDEFELTLNLVLN